MSNYARYVGRVGALAVALGVGSAVAAMPAAVADTTNSGSAGSAHALPASAGSSSSSTTSSTSTPTPPAAARRPAAALTAHPHRFRPIGVGGDRRANRFGLSRRDRGRRVSDRGTFRGKVPEVPEGARSPSRPPEWGGKSLDPPDLSRHQWRHSPSGWHMSKLPGRTPRSDPNCGDNGFHGW